MGRGWWYKTLWETAPSEVTYVFEKEVIFHEFDLNTHNLVWWQGWFFFHYYLASTMTDLAQIFTDSLFYAYVDIQQLRRLAFDNYQ